MAPTPALARHSNAIFWVGATAVYALSATVLHTLPGFDRPDRIAAAVVFDLTVSVTMLAWLLPVRSGRWPAAALVPIFLAGVAAARLLTPPVAAGTRSLVTTATLAGEIGVLAWLAWRVRGGFVVARRAGPELDLLARLRLGARAALWSRAVAEAAAFELAVLAYAFGGRREPHVPAGCVGFGYGRRTPYGPVVAALSFVVIAETVLVHFLLARWSERAAWIVTAFGLYTILYLVADWRATAERPILLGDERLVVRTGLRWTVNVPRGVIVSAERRPPTSGRPLRAALLGAANVWLHLDEPVEALGVYGRRRRTKVVALAVDEPDRFVAALARDF